MRLLRFNSSGKAELTRDFSDVDVPPYAILSHTWGRDDEEVKLQDLQSRGCEDKPGYFKIRFCGQQARKDGLDYWWVDSCCIDKTNSVELSESLNSMFKWYQRAVKCYAYLSDVHAHKRDYEGSSDHLLEAAFRASKWHTRGWTLQEMLAPAQVEFFSSEGVWIGNKPKLQDWIHDVTRIPTSALQAEDLNVFDVRERRRWAAGRKTGKPEDRAYSLLGIFNVSMPLLYGEGEQRAFARLEDEIGKNLTRQLRLTEELSSHQTATANSGKNSPNGTAAIKEISVEERRAKLLDSLAFEQMDSRHLTIKKAFSSTCRWLTKHPTYKAWCDSSEAAYQFLWINGKPGAGKSTLMKYIVAEAGKNKSDEEIQIRFFFNARGDTMEKSTTGMYRSLLFQIFAAAPDLQVILEDVQFPRPHLVTGESWKIGLLCEVLTIAMEKLGTRPLRCFIDALDECDEDEVREMVQFFENVSEQTQERQGKIKICFASRHYPTIEIHNGQKLDLEHEEGHGEDLAKYIKSHLRAGKGKQIEEVREEVLQKANGVFMWAVLVVGILNKEFIRGRIFQVKKRLREVPLELSELFRDLLRRDNTNMSDLKLCLQWVLFAKRPLSREEFYFAMVSGLDPDAENLAPWDPEQVTADDMKRFLLNASKGLAELTTSGTPTVQFIHESVRDFLLKDKGFQDLWPNENSDVICSGHERLKQCCREYLAVDLSDFVPSTGKLPKANDPEMKVARSTVRNKFPFLGYACQYILWHSNEAASAFSQGDFVTDFPRKRFVFLTNVLQQHETHRYTSDASLLYLCAESDHAQLVAELYTSPLCLVKRENERYDYPFLAAVRKESYSAARAMLKKLELDVEDTMSKLPFGRDPALRKTENIFTWALESGLTSLHAFLTRNLLVLWCPDWNLLSYLKSAIKNGDKTFVSALAVVPGCTGTICGDEAGNLMSLACKTANTAICNNLVPLFHSDVKTSRMWIPWALRHGASYGDIKLVEHAFNTDRPWREYDNRDLPCIIAAAGNGHTELVEFFLSKDANIEGVFTGSGDVVSYNNYYQTDTPLIAAARNGHLATVQVLLERGASTETLNQEGDTALFAASEDGHVEVVQMLLKAGADIHATINHSSSDNLTALHCALGSGSSATVLTLLNAGADAKARTGSGKTPLMYLSGKAWDVDPVRLLLHHGAEIEARDQHGLTALMHLKDVVAIELLLLNGANTQATDVSGETALMLAAYRCDVKSIAVLLEHGANIHATNIHGRTALMEASESIYNNKEAMELLLSHGANIEATDVDGQTALMKASAVFLNDSDAVELLLSRGANIEATDNKGETALMMAAKSAFRFPQAQALLKQGARNRPLSNSTTTALSIARVHDNERVVQLFLIHGFRDDDANDEPLPHEQSAHVE